MSSEASAAVRVLRGTPSAEELAALVAVLCARPASAAPSTDYEVWRAKRLAAVRRTRS